MAFRFQRRIKIAPGIRLNLSKSGVGVSAGIRGASLSAGSRGIYGHTGIPGTGLAYRTKLNSTSRNSTKRSHSSRDVGDGAVINLKAYIEDNGQLRFYNADTLADLTDREFNYVKNHYSAELAALIQALCDNKNQQLSKISTVHHNIPPPQERPVFTARTCPEVRPEQPRYLKFGLLAMFWPPLKRKIQSHNASLKAKFAAELRQYHEAKEAFDKSEAQRKKKETKDVFDDVEAMSAVLEDHLLTIEWPYETEVDFDFGEDYSSLAIDVCFPDESQLPLKHHEPLKTFSKVSIKPINASTRRRLYRDHIHAITLRIIAEAFHRLPSLESLTLSGYTPGVNSATGYEEDHYLLSVKVLRERWKNINFESTVNIDPVAALEQFELQRNMTKTGIFKPIQPMSL